MTDENKPENLPQKAEPTVSERFTNMVLREFGQEAGAAVAFTDVQKRLAQHLCIKVETSLKELEAKRLKNGTNKPPIVWANINMQKLAVDAFHRVQLGLDGLIPNHIHVAPYLNGKTGKYDLDLQVGYVGKDYYYRQMAVDAPEDITYELVYSNDELVVHKKGVKQPFDTYELTIKNPFDRGNVVGGIGYIQYKNKLKNRLVIITMKDFNKSKAAAPNKTIWEAHPEAMQYKTIVNRTVAKILLDPQKINASFAEIENSEMQALEHTAQRQIEQHANKTVIDIDQKKNLPAEQSTPASEESQGGQGGQIDIADLERYNELFVERQGSLPWHYAQGVCWGDEKATGRVQPTMIKTWLNAFDEYATNVEPETQASAGGPAF